jgi:hypothetical protein
LAYLIKHGFVVRERFREGTLVTLPDYGREQRRKLGIQNGSPEAPEGSKTDPRKGSETDPPERSFPKLTTEILEITDRVLAADLRERLVMAGRISDVGGYRPWPYPRVHGPSLHNLTHASRTEGLHPERDAKALRFLASLNPSLASKLKSRLSTISQVGRAA